MDYYDKLTKIHFWIVIFLSRCEILAHFRPVWLGLNFELGSISIFAFKNTVSCANPHASTVDWSKGFPNMSFELFGVSEFLLCTVWNSRFGEVAFQIISSRVCFIIKYRRDSEFRQNSELPLSQEDSTTFFPPCRLL